MRRLELGLGVLTGHALVTAQGVVGLLDALGRDAGGLEDRARVGLVVGERAEQVLGGDVGVAHLGRELLRGVAHANGGVGHAHLRGVTADLRLARDGIVDLRLDRGRVGADALDDGADVVLAGAEQRLENVNGHELPRVGVCGDADGRLQRLLGRDGPLV